MMRPGMGFIENRYWRGDCHASSLKCDGGCDRMTALLSRSLIFDDSTIIPN